ncbi:dipeptide/oligopeptide/nickel ABC transporter permease/ATP-binding protein [Arthrobacter sp. B2a2-09]|uniref:dipeptide/oligopeptide/nickel ABC transporter permease/ATP-binding protein n=1 Tax=Arthrobacter sp. B2a2-09 TaxID=2952822 RepID=UPI0022CD4DC5|nr:dipeptide/oligopeptide/nickel ABC transporter permease/ATP-binding protein [Arthrobacter sp. B2a2-09]MCZ9880615.1 dipeptide/oligopeptide/nickel ABC transporter permease/ATP-binding protein [Arthrobacter sp. B2a2-09]
MSNDTATEQSALPAAKGRTPLWKKLLKDPQSSIAGGVIFIIVLLGVLAPWITGHGPNTVRLESINSPFNSPGYPLGTDQYGRDIWSRLLHSINTSSITAVISTTIAIGIGSVFGLVGGYFDRLRGITEWVFALIMTFPGMLVLILLLPITGGDFRITMAIFGVMLSPGIYRIVRNQVVGVKSELYIDAARVSGVSTIRILVRHVFSAVRGPVIIAAAFMAGSAISIQAGLAFLGVGSKETPSFGAMINDGFRNLYIDPLQYIWPSLLLGIINAALVLFGNALRDAMQGAQPKPAKIGQKVDAKAGAAGQNKISTVGKPSGNEGVPFLEVTDLVIAYPRPDGSLNDVVHGVNLRIEAAETLGLVGESGSGKTQTAFAILGVLPPEAVVRSGSIRVGGRELIGMTETDLRRIRGKQIAYIPQEPMSNLDPVYTVGAQLVEGIRAATGVSARAAKERALSLLARVGIPEPIRTFGAYPHQISGGMAQRVLIAGAVASNPKLLIADEPTTALDVTVQAEILDLLRDLQEELGMAVLLVTHNFGVVADICSRISVMHGGQIVETGDVFDVFREPQHEYTQKLLNAILDETSHRKDPPVETLELAGGAKR